MLGHRRLSIIDPTERGTQPMISPRTGAVITYNGEVYNFREIRNELSGLGYAFVSQCDTEVVLAAYDQWGPDCVVRFNGMFAFVIYDPRSQSVFAARDRLGIKPLYYFSDGSAFSAGSELLALTALDCGQLAVNPDALSEYFGFGQIGGGQTALTRYAKLQPGHLLIFDIARQSVGVRQYWNALDYYQSAEWQSDEQTLEDELEQLLLRSIKRRLISDVPLGAFLSGGIDSSLVVALMQEASSTRVQTFTIGFDLPSMDEAPYAKRIAESLGTEHHELYVSARSVEDELISAADLYDEPFADSSAIPTMLLSRMTRENVTVALSGDGGDELFFGYLRYRAAVLYRRMLLAPLTLRKLGGSLLDATGRFRPRCWSYIMQSRDVSDMYVRMMQSYGNSLMNCQNGQSSVAALAHQTSSAIGKNRVEKWAPATDLLSYLPDDLLTKVDRASMAVSLEARVPLLDHEIVEYAARIPHVHKYRGGVSKYLLRNILNKRCPAELFDRPKKGFGIPIAPWFRKELRDWVMDQLTSNWDWTLGVVDPDRVHSLLADHMSGRANYAPVMWACIVWKSWATRAGLVG